MPEVARFDDDDIVLLLGASRRSITNDACWALAGVEDVVDCVVGTAAKVARTAICTIRMSFEFFSFSNLALQFFFFFFTDFDWSGLDVGSAPDWSSSLTLEHGDFCPATPHENQLECDLQFQFASSFLSHRWLQFWFAGSGGVSTVSGGSLEIDQGFVKDRQGRLLLQLPVEQGHVAPVNGDHFGRREHLVLEPHGALADVLFAQR